MADDAPWLLVGLGNPGPSYAANRHNVGFQAVERWLEQFVPAPPLREKHKGQSCSVNDRRFGRTVVLLPQTYMNRSGDSVQPAAAYHRTPVERIVVVHDELDFEFGRVAIKKGGGHGGHNGLRDIVRATGSRDFLRIRVGIGRPQHGDVSKWVLSDFAGEDAAFVPDLLDRTRDAIDCLLAKGIKTAMNEFNGSPASTGGQLEGTL